MNIVNGQIASLAILGKMELFTMESGKMGWPLVMERWNGIGVILT